MLSRFSILRVIIESPYSGDVEKNLEYARICLSDSLSREVSPFASHLIYTQVLNDEIQDERLLGMKNAFMWYKYADLMAVYIDLGVSKGMLEGIEKAHKYDIPIEIRKVD